MLESVGHLLVVSGRLGWKLMLSLGCMLELDCSSKTTLLTTVEPL